MDKDQDKSRRLSRMDWIKASISVMTRSSIEQVKVEKIARDLGVSKGSFYWHFKDREDLLAQILNEWKVASTFGIQTRLEDEEPSPARRLLRFMELPLRSASALRAADLELAILGWARRSDEAAQAVREVDAARCLNLAGLFREMGFDAAEATFRAHQAYALLRYVAQRRDLPLDERHGLVTVAHARLIER